MYVRWKRKRNQESWRERVYLSAVMVESQRVKGKPRQNFIAHLGSIIENHMHSEYALEDFYRKVTCSFNQLGLDQETRLKILETLQKKVPKPDPADLERKRRKALETLPQRVQDLIKQRSA